MSTVVSPAPLRGVLSGLETIGRAALLAVSIVRILPRPRMYLRSFINQAYLMGIRSLPLVLLMAFLGGAVTSQQTGAQFTGALPLWVIGSVVAASVITELGPVLTAIVLVGRIGASIAAEIASMKVTEQIDALYAMGRDPVVYLVVPRVLAGVVVLPPLVVLADAMGVFSGWGIGLLVVDGLTSADFVYGMRFYFRPWALIFSVLKAGAFGFAITFLACFIGLEGRGGAEGVGRTTTAAVVATTIAIMVLDVALVPVLKMY
ncbi:MAG TPA: ABC transporter permease [Longimicrobiales bacterium]|nr:ABC transporter permease [Longimicrobiales bacterium]